MDLEHAILFVDKISGQLGGKYGCIRFLRDVYLTALEVD